MRRFLALIAIPLLACLVLAGCGGSSKSTASSSSSASSSAAASPGANTAVTATGAFDKTPKVTIPKATPGNSLTVRTLIQGTGTTLTKSDALAANFVLYFWQGNQLLAEGQHLHQQPDGDRRHDAARPGVRADRQEGRQPRPRRHPARAGVRHLGQLPARHHRQHHAGVRHRRAQVLRRHRGRDRHPGVQRRRQPAHRQRQVGHRAHRDLPVLLAAQRPGDQDAGQGQRRRRSPRATTSSRSTPATSGGPRRSSAPPGRRARRSASPSARRPSRSSPAGTRAWSARPWAAG